MARPVAKHMMPMHKRNMSQTAMKYGVTRNSTAGLNADLSVMNKSNAIKPDTQDIMDVKKFEAAIQRAYLATHHQESNLELKVQKCRPASRM